MFSAYTPVCKYYCLVDCHQYMRDFNIARVAPVIEIDQSYHDFASRFWVICRDVYVRSLIDRIRPQSNSH